VASDVSTIRRREGRGFHRYTGRFPAEPIGIAVVRGEVSAIAEECGATPQQRGDIELAVTEAATNALVHGYKNAEGGWIYLDVFCEDDELLVIVGDRGAGMRPRTDSPGLGIGLSVIATVSEAMEVISSDAGCEVHMRFRCPHGITEPV
jgi:serine/threonine-protein kinase RsbW/stage II sporulation protein AB (anti-sigma F factor)